MESPLPLKFKIPVSIHMMGLRIWWTTLEHINLTFSYKGHRTKLVSDLPDYMAR
jgi:hypothetical protein